MKKNVILLFGLIICFPLFAQELTLDQAINESSIYFSGRLPKAGKVAVTNFGAGSFGSLSSNISSYIIVELEKHLVNNGGFSMVDRQNLENARRELNFNMSGEVSDASAQSIGQFLGAQVVVFGSIKPLGNIIRFEVRALRVETAEIIGIYTGNINGNDITRIFGRPAKPPRPNPFRGYNPFNGLTIFGYTYSFDRPIGFNLGAYGVYTSMNFAVPNWGDYDRHGVGSCNNGISHVAPNFNSAPFRELKYEIIDWTMGYNITIVKNILYLPIGVGVEAVKEWRLQEMLHSSGSIWSDNYEWNPSSEWANSFLFELGLLVRIKMLDNFGPYIMGTYRNIGLNEKHSFTIGIGGSFDFIHN